MQLNSNPIRGIRNIRAIITCVIFFLAGLVFAGIGVYLLINPSAHEGGDTSNAKIMDFVFIGVGVLVALIAVLIFVRTIKMMREQKPLSEEEVKINEANLNVNAPHIENLKNVKLYFHPTGKLNQSFVAVDKEGNKKYECNLKKFNPLGANTFEFKDVDHSYSRVVKIGKTLTTREGTGYMFVGDVSSSGFKINGVRCWDYLRQRGYEIKHFILEKNIFHYELYKLGNKVVDIFPCNHKDPWNENSKNYFMMGRGYFRIEIIDCKLEDAVMAAFIVQQTEIVE